jgi:hypothetical protein
LGFQAIKSNCDCTSNITDPSGLLSIFKFSTAVLLNYSGSGCLLPTQVQLQLYLLTTQPVVIFDQFSSSTTAVLLNYSGYGCLLSTEVQLKLYVLHILRLSCVLLTQNQCSINQNFIFSQYFNFRQEFQPKSSYFHGKHT